jgi:hypothetical protein
MTAKKQLVQRAVRPPLTWSYDCVRFVCRFVQNFFVVSNVPPPVFIAPSSPIVDRDGRTSKVETRVQIERPLAPLGFVSDGWTWNKKKSWCTLSYAPPFMAGFPYYLCFAVILRYSAKQGTRFLSAGRPGPYGYCLLCTSNYVKYYLDRRGTRARPPTHERQEN